MTGFRLKRTFGEYQYLGILSHFYNAAHHGSLAIWQFGSEGSSPELAWSCV